MAPSQIDFWFTMGSTYSYLSVLRLPDVARSTGVSFHWRPFHLLVILQEMKHVPFADKPAKLTYMWRDIERRAALYGFSTKLPAPYPAKHSVVANLIAVLGMKVGGRNLSAQLIGAGSHSDRKLAMSLTYRKVCGTSGKIRNVYFG
jgi:2-hydroxychromene-2-carboxylate isomerase